MARAPSWGSVPIGRGQSVRVGSERTRLSDVQSTCLARAGSRPKYDLDLLQRLDIARLLSLTDRPIDTRLTAVHGMTVANETIVNIAQAVDSPGPTGAAAPSFELAASAASTSTRDSSRRASK